MDWKTLKKIADADSISTVVDNDNGIVVVNFTVNGAPIDAQFSTQIKGIYAFSIWGSTDLLKLLGLDENGDPLTTGENDDNEED